MVGEVDPAALPRGEVIGGTHARRELLLDHAARRLPIHRGKQERGHPIEFARRAGNRLVGHPAALSRHGAARLNPSKASEFGNKTFEAARVVEARFQPRGKRGSIGRKAGIKLEFVVEERGIESVDQATEAIWRKLIDPRAGDRSRFRRRRHGRAASAREWRRREISSRRVRSWRRHRAASNRGDRPDNRRAGVRYRRTWSPGGSHRDGPGSGGRA